MRRASRRSSLVTTMSVGVILAGALAGCGSSGGGGAAHKTTGHSKSASSSARQGSAANKSASQVVDDAKSALFNAKSVHATGTMSAKGKQQKLDLWFVGRNTAGTQTIDGTVVHIIKIGDTAYLKAPASFWKKTAGSQGAALGGKWIKASGKTSNISALTLQALAASINTDDSPLRSGVGHGSIRGKKALVVTQQDGSKMYVADATPPVPLRLTNSGASKGSLDFRDYGAKHPIAAPKGAVTAKQAVSQAHPTQA